MIILRDDNGRSYLLNGLPNPVIIAINVNGKQPDGLVWQVIGKKLIDIGDRNESPLGFQRPPAVKRVTPNEINVLL